LFRRSFKEFDDKINFLLDSFEIKDENEIQKDLRLLEENFLFDFYRQEINKKLEEREKKKHMMLLKEKEDELEKIRFLEFMGIKPEPILESKNRTKELEQKIKTEKTINPPFKFDFSKIKLVQNNTQEKEMNQKSPESEPEPGKKSLIFVTPPECGYKECTFVNLVIKKGMKRIKEEDFEFYKYAKQRGIFNQKYLKMKGATKRMSTCFLRHDKEKNDFFLEEDLREEPLDLIKELESEFFHSPIQEGYRNSMIFCDYFLNNQTGKNVNRYKTFCKLVICDIFNEVMKKQGRFLEYRKSLRVFVPKLLETINKFEIEMTSEINV
jgi:hypothetical protein